MLREGAEVRVGGLFRGDRGQQHALVVMGRHVPDEGLVNCRIPADPWQFAIVGSEQGAGPQ
jgi:hypothetical protein